MYLSQPIISILKLNTLGKNFSRRQIGDIFSYFCQKTGLDISCKLSPVETICMNCPILFSGKNKKKYHQFVVCWISPEGVKFDKSKMLTDTNSAAVSCHFWWYAWWIRRKWNCHFHEKMHLISYSIHIYQCSASTRCLNLWLLFTEALVAATILANNAQFRLRGCATYSGLRYCLPLKGHLQVKRNKCFQRLCIISDFRTAVSKIEKFNLRVWSDLWGSRKV